MIREIFKSEHGKIGLFSGNFLQIRESWPTVDTPYLYVFLDMIATLGEVTGHSALRKLHSKMLDDPEGRVILR